MTPDDRNKRIKSYGSAHQLLVSALARFPQEMWQFRPSPDRWTIHEILIHIADNEVNGYLRCRRFIAEPGDAILGYDENKWTRHLNYHSQSTEDALELFKWLRHASYKLIKNLPESVWSHTVHHTEAGLMTMEDWFAKHERHIPEHIEQMEANYNAWLSKKEPVEPANTSN